MNTPAEQARSSAPGRPQRPPLGQRITAILCLCVGLPVAAFGVWAMAVGVHLLYVAFTSGSDAAGFMVFPAAAALLVGGLTFGAAAGVLAVGFALSRARKMPAPVPAAAPPVTPAVASPPAARAALSPHLCWLNLVFPGLAQILFGQKAKGGVLLLLVFALTTLSPFVLYIVGGPGVRMDEAPPWMYYAIDNTRRLVLAIYALSILDAFMVGRAIRSGRSLSGWATFPRAKRAASGLSL